MRDASTLEELNFKFFGHHNYILSGQNNLGFDHNYVNVSPCGNFIIYQAKESEKQSHYVAIHEIKSFF